MKKFLLTILVVFSWGYLSNLKAEISQSSKKSQNDSIKPASEKIKIVFSFKPKLGMTFSDGKSDGIRTTNLQWIGTINSNFDFFGPGFQLNSNLFLKYGQQLEKGVDPKTIGNSLIWSVTPSFPILKTPPLRLFIESCLETPIGKGLLNSKPIYFLDPIFLYQTIFVGQRNYSHKKNQKTNWDFTYGIGYSFQETINNAYNLAGSKTGFESGLSGIAEFKVNSQISESVDFELQAKALALVRDDFFSLTKMRRTLLIRSGLFYKKVGIEYLNRIVHDTNLSAETFFEQSLMFTLSF